MKWLTKLTINKFRNVAPTTLEFRPGINVLLGRNAAGKTSLLRLISSQLGSENEVPQDEPLDVGIHIKGHAFELAQTTLRVRGNEPVTPINIGQRDMGPFSRVHQTESLSFTLNDKLVLRASLTPTEVIFEREGKRERAIRTFLDRPIQSLATLFLQPPQAPEVDDLGANLLSAQTHTAGRMDESLETLKALLKLQIQVEGGSRLWRFLKGVPVSMFGLAGQTIPEGTTATFRFAVLDRAARVLGFESATARFDVERITPEPSRHVVRLSNLKFYFVRADEQVSHEWLSYGQKRLLAFFAHADASPDIVIADELVNGLHHEWISACLNELQDRQSFLTSQNPLLLDFLRFDSVEDVRHTFILCERAHSDSGEQLIWRNLNEDEAESFFLAYQTGIQRVSDILLTKGLW